MYAADSIHLLAQDLANLYGRIVTETSNDRFLGMQEYSVVDGPDALVPYYNIEGRIRKTRQYLHALREQIDAVDRWLQIMLPRDQRISEQVGGATWKEEDSAFPEGFMGYNAESNTNGWGNS
jgi:hypothetical protein